VGHEHIVLSRVTVFGARRKRISRNCRQTTVIVKTSAVLITVIPTETAKAAGFPPQLWYFLASIV